MSLYYVEAFTLKSWASDQLCDCNVPHAHLCHASQILQQTPHCFLPTLQKHYAVVQVNTTLAMIKSLDVQFICICKQNNMMYQSKRNKQTKPMYCTTQQFISSCSLYCPHSIPPPPPIPPKLLHQLDRTVLCTIKDKKQEKINLFIANPIPLSPHLSLGGNRPWFSGSNQSSQGPNPWSPPHGPLFGLHIPPHHTLLFYF